jgi:PPOX class probable F420-dependent enzyme
MLPEEEEAVELPHAAREILLRRWPVARLATLGPAGAPRLVPIVFAWHAGRLFSPVDGKPKAGDELARLRDVQRDPRVCVLLDGYAGDWSRLWWLRLDGVAEVLRAAHEGDPLLVAPAEALRAKYPQYRSTPLFRGEPTLLAVRVERARGWCAGPEAIPRE